MCYKAIFTMLAASILFVAPMPLAEDLPPVLDPIGNRHVYVGETLSFFVTAADPDGPVVMNIENKPEGAVFTDLGYDSELEKYKASFVWTPDESDVGNHTDIVFSAWDLVNPPVTESIRIIVGKFPCADANVDGATNLLDILYLIAFLYDIPNGPEPPCP